MSPIEDRLKQIMAAVCEEHHAEIEALEVMPDHMHLPVSVDPQFGLHRLVKLIKGRSSQLLRQEFLVVKRTWPSVGTKSSFVSTTGGAPSEYGQAVHRAAKTCLRRRISTGSTPPRSRSRS